MLETLKSSKLSIRVLFVSGILLIVLGIVFVLLSLRYEVLDEKYIVREVTTYKSSKNRLKQGQIAVSKDLDYVGEGVYRITYRNYYNAKDSEILSPNSEFGIVDMFGDGYELDLEDITINSDKYEVTEETKVEPVKQEVSVPFFGGPAEAVNNPIPVQEKPQNYEIVLDWLNECNKFNGFYILGI